MESTYRYYVLPAPTLGEPITRFPDANSRDHETHFPPFSNLGPLESHVRPHFVVFNSGQKLSNPKSLGRHAANMGLALKQIVPPSIDAFEMVVTMQSLYAAWTEVQVPDDFDMVGTLDRLGPSSEGGRDDGSQRGSPPRRRSQRSAARSRTQGSTGHYDGGQQRAIYALEDSSVTDDTIVEDDIAWIEGIDNWRKEGEDVGESGGSEVLDRSCDEQLAAYIDEHARTPPSPDAWNSWKPAWDGRKSRQPSAFERAKFSSNDWAVFKNGVYLTRFEQMV